MERIILWHPWNIGDYFFKSERLCSSMRQIVSATHVSVLNTKGMHKCSFKKQKTKTRGSNEVLSTSDTWTPEKVQNYGTPSLSKNSRDWTARKPCIEEKQMRKTNTQHEETQN